MTDARIAVVGAGPSGIFCAMRIKAKYPAALVDVLDRAPTPYGLVRYGVAPDHVRIKSVVRVLAKGLQQPGVRFLGGVAVGPGEREVSLVELRARYHAVVLAHGAEIGRRLEVPGSDLLGNWTAGELVSWYNGHPQARRPDNGPWRSVVVVGGGNVALDVTRVLLKAGGGLQHTDIPRPTLQELDDLKVREVHVVVRKGPAATRFGLTELTQLQDLPDTHLMVSDTSERRAADGDADPVEQILRTWQEKPAGPTGARLVHFHFGAAVSRVHGTSAVEGVSLALGGGAPDQAVALLRAQAVVAAIGFRSAAMPGVPSDGDGGTVIHEQGRVAPGLYVVGWAKRGPQGVIGTNKACASETADLVVCDLASLAGPDRGGVDDLIAARGIDVVDWAQWLDADAAEIALGRSEGVERIKLLRRGWS